MALYYADQEASVLIRVWCLNLLFKVITSPEPIGGFPPYEDIRNALLAFANLTIFR